MKRIAVLGGGGTGCCLAADLALRGHQVALYEKKEYWHEHIEGIRKRGGIEVGGKGLTGFAKLALITDSLAAALQGSELVFIAMVAWRHNELAQELKPLLKEGDTVVFSAGNFGSIILKRILGLDSGVITGEMMGNIFPCRMLGEGSAVCASPYAPKMIAAFPAVDNKRLCEAYSEVYPCTEAKNVFEAALNAPNVVIHLAGSILNACAVDRDSDFAFYRSGLSESVINCQKAVEAEKARLMEKLGYKMIMHTDYMEKLVQYDKYPEFDCFRDLKGPDSMQHRYVREDATVGDSILMRLGSKLGVEMPTVRALVTIAGAVNNTDYFSTGLTLEELGVTGSTPDEINGYLLTGESR